MEAIVTHSLGKVYGNGTLALNDLTLSISQGTIFGFLGPNGAGKSTTTRILNGTLGASSGQAEILGQPCGSQALRRKTATTTETARMYDALTVEANLAFYGRMHDLSALDIRQRTAELLERLGLPEKRRMRLAQLSTGQKKRIQLARALLHRPELLFLDEPTSGLDPQVARETVAMIRDLADNSGTTVLLCTHDLSLADTVCDAFGFIANGSLRASGTRRELQSAAGLGEELRVVTTSGERRYPLEGQSDANAILTRLLGENVRIREARRECPSLESLYFHFIKNNQELNHVP